MGTFTLGGARAELEETESQDVEAVDAEAVDTRLVSVSKRPIAPIAPFSYFLLLIPPILAS